MARENSIALKASRFRLRHNISFPAILVHFQTQSANGSHEKKLIPAVYRTNAKGTFAKLEFVTRDSCSVATNFYELHTHRLARKSSFFFFFFVLVARRKLAHVFH